MKKILFLFVSCLMLHSGFAQQLILKGRVIADSGEGIPYVLVSDSINNKALYTDSNGDFVFHLKSSKVELKFHHVSYIDKYLKIEENTDTFMTIILQSPQIQEVLVKGIPLNRQAMLGLNVLERKTVKNLPNFFGEPDILKAITILPGFSSGVDMYSSIYVRGGNRDQNLFLVDGARFYTTSHAGGYLSLFNSDIIKNIEAYKGNAPAEFGHGTSSVINVCLNEGDNTAKLSFDIGTLRSGFHAETKGSGKFYAMVAGRYSQLNLIYGNKTKGFDFMDQNQSGEVNDFSFNDIDFKLAYKPQIRTNISLSGHWGKDADAYYRTFSAYDMGTTKIENTGGGNFIDNGNTALNINHVFNSGVSLKSTSYYTYYKLTHSYREEQFENSKNKNSISNLSNSHIKDLTQKIKIKIPLQNHYIQTGLQLSRYIVDPFYGSTKNKLELIDRTYTGLETKALEGSFFIDDNYQITTKTQLRLGLRNVLCALSDTNYVNFEPRISLSHQLDNNWVAKAGFSINNQPFQVLVDRNGEFERETWVLANKNYKPQSSQQFSAGIFGSIPNTTIDISTELYYKTMSNLLHFNYEDNSQLVFWDQITNNGKGKSYGAEVLLSKSEGKVQWSIAYTFAFSKRKFETLNQGNWYNSDFDRRHDLNIGLNYFRNAKNSWAFNYIYQSGRPFTMPLGKVKQTDFYTGYYVVGNANNARMPAYKRFDLSYKHAGKLFRTKAYDFTVSVMNLFARANPLSVYVRKDKLYMSSWYRIIPSANLKIYFKK